MIPETIEESLEYIDREPVIEGVEDALGKKFRTEKIWCNLFGDDLVKCKGVSSFGSTPVEDFRIVVDEVSGSGDASFSKRSHWSKGQFSLSGEKLGDVLTCSPMIIPRSDGMVKLKCGVDFEPSEEPITYYEEVYDDKEKLEKRGLCVTSRFGGKE